MKGATFILGGFVMVVGGLVIWGGISGFMASMLAAFIDQHILSIGGQASYNQIKQGGIGGYIGSPDASGSVPPSQYIAPGGGVGPGGTGMGTGNAPGYEPPGGIKIA